MASADLLRDEMYRALKIMDDKSKPFDVRRAARSRFWHCEKRLGTMERGNLNHDDPGHHLIGYSEIGLTADKTMTPPASESTSRRQLLDARSDAHFRAKERL